MSNTTNGAVVRRLEEAFAKYVGASYGIACCNGTATLHTALVALGVKHNEEEYSEGWGDAVMAPPLTMASTTLGILHAGGEPRFRDVARDTWVMKPKKGVQVAVSLYGLWSGAEGNRVVDDAAETINPHRGAVFTSYSFQASKILSAGEGGMLVTNDEQLAMLARSFRDLGYPATERRDLKRPDAIRHMSIGYNYRMSDAQAQLVLDQLPHADALLGQRRYAASCYRQAIQGCDWITPQYVPDGWSHSYWTYAIALRSKEMWHLFVDALVAAGSERPYAAWRLTYQEPAFRHLASDGTCPVAEDLQPRLVQLQTNYTHTESEQAAERLAAICKRLAFD